jgi:hypothetical protein
MRDETMGTEHAGLRITFFPHTFVSNRDWKRLALYFPTIRLLRLSPNADPDLPGPLSGAGVLQPYAPVINAGLREIIDRALRAYQQLGSLHRHPGLVESMRALVLQEDVEGSRTDLIARLREARPKLSPEEVDLVEAAVYLLLAHELDREYLEVERRLERIRNLENDFRKTLGIDTGKEADLTLEPSSFDTLSRPPAQQPLQRLRAWTRLHLSQEAENLLVPITTSPEVVAEIQERLPAQLAPLHKNPQALPPAYLLCRLPDPEQLSLEDVLALRESLSSKGMLQDWWQAVATSIHRLQRQTAAEEEWVSLQEQLQVLAGAFQERWPEYRPPELRLELQATVYRRLQPHLAFALTTGLRASGPGLLSPEGTNGVSLLLAQ